MVIQRLFDEGSLAQYLDAVRESLNADIERLDRNRFLNSSVEDLVEYFVAKFGLDAPTLLEDQITADEREIQVDVSQEFHRFIRDRTRPSYVSGVAITLHIPFRGDAQLLRFTPSSYYSGGSPLGRVNGGEILLRYETADLDPEPLKRWQTESLETLRQYVQWVAEDVNNYNRSTQKHARAVIESRRERLLRGQGLVASLGVPLRPRPDAPSTMPVHDIRRRTVPPPPASEKPFLPEPALDEATYEQILSLIRPMGTTMERDPRAFGDLDEESLRAFFLATLNSHYQGRATGETFNVSGKTDIVIRENDRNIFVAECKFWRGAKSLGAAIDQLLGYTSWRDTKTALLVFVRLKEFAPVVAQIPSLVQAHPSYKRALRQVGPSEWRATFGIPTDASRELILSVILFHVPQNQ